ncbi:PEGA domain-containing protein [Persicimonas caeni]|uniref:PEGA domain-containing protein n=1 Tax=Persicimonas caeni TaxID=2292766 RepID=A0A4Y6Q2L7_PERCE|nr:PEGA domain-containing protein [Persicimonas caeni]QDG54782.1 PEGA domain-containing protein [Persicimonas caeni]QED36003.1 PEGA domain-containing protein [Persicimonas caeni]
MRQSQHQGVMRPFVAVFAALAFVFSPFAVLAQQSADGEQQKEGEGEQAQPAKPAGPTPKLFVVPTQGVRDEISSIIPERVGEMLRGQLEGKSQIELLPSYEKLQKQGGGRANAAVAEAERLYTSGIGLLTAGEDEKASKTFQKAVDIMEQNIADLTNFDVLADAYKNMALAYFNAGYDFDGRKKMKVFAHLRPEATLDAEKFPKELRQVFEDEAKKVKKGGPGKLIIEADVDEALVYIDGVMKGKTPATVEDVGYGYHYMVVRSPSGGVWSEQIRVRGRGKKQDFKVELGAGKKQQAGEDDSDAPAFYSGLQEAIKSGSFATKELEPYLSELVTRTGAQYVGWVAMVRQGREYVAAPFVYRASDGLLVQADSVKFNIQLSNLRVGVSQLANRMVTAVETMPEDKAITSVELGAPEEEEKPTVAAGAGESKTEDAEQGQSEGAGAEAGEEKPTEVAAADEEKDEGQSVKPLPEPDPSDKEGESDKWLWIGGGAAALGVALVVGGIVYAADSGSDGPESFDAQLTW